jgi:membrane protein DedA with SNARE-associated domain
MGTLLNTNAGMARYDLAVFLTILAVPAALFLAVAAGDLARLVWRHQAEMPRCLFAAAVAVALAPVVLVHEVWARWRNRTADSKERDWALFVRAHSDVDKITVPEDTDG